MPQQQLLGKDERRLLKCFKALSESDRHTLLRFAEFLSQGQALSEAPDDTGEPSELQLPVDVEAKEDETVIGAIKRLSARYPMIDKSTLLTETSDLMTQHLVQGKEAAQVIKELETVFENAYAAYKAAWEEQSGGGNG